MQKKSYSNAIPVITIVAKENKRIPRALPRLNLPLSVDTTISVTQGFSDQVRKREGRKVALTFPVKTGVWPRLIVTDRFPEYSITFSLSPSLPYFFLIPFFLSLFSTMYSFRGRAWIPSLGDTRDRKQWQLFPSTLVSLLENRNVARRIWHNR